MCVELVKAFKSMIVLLSRRINRWYSTYLFWILYGEANAFK